MSDHTPAPASHEICVEAAVLRTMGLTMEQQMLMADRLDKIATRVERLERLERATQLKARERWYFVIPMPVQPDGQGPAALKDAAEVLFEVWDQALATHGSFNNLPDAIDACEALNAARNEKRTP